MKATSEKKLKLGWISYLNLFPLKYEIQKNLSDNFELSYGPPSKINKLLREDSVQLAPSSSICLLRDDPLYTIPIGVCSKGKVHSVYLGLQKEHIPFYQEFLLHKECYKNNIKNIISQKTTPQKKVSQLLAQQNKTPLKNTPSLKFTNESETSVELSKILLTLILGQENTKKMLKEPSTPLANPIQLLIGDKALLEAKNFHSLIDLGELWSEITSLPFVYAVWQGTQRIPGNLETKLLNLSQKTQDKMHQDPDYYTDKLSLSDTEHDRKHLRSYWRSLFYMIGDRENEGFKIFLQLARKLRF